MLDINWNRTIDFELQQYFNEHLPDVLFKTHYDLAEASGYDAEVWREFLLHPQVDAFIASELDFINRKEMSKLTQDLTKHGTSVGFAQNLTALSKTIGTSQKKDGPVFVYTYIPLNNKEIQAENIVCLDEDPFLQEEQ